MVTGLDIYKLAIEIFELQKPYTHQEELTKYSTLSYIEECENKASTPLQKEFVSALKDLAKAKENHNCIYEEQIKATKNLVNSRDALDNRINFVFSLGKMCLE